MLLDDINLVATPVENLGKCFPDVFSGYRNGTLA